jgi:hypothetical protein
MKKLFYTMVLCLFTSTLAFAQTNLVTNPGFETVNEDGTPADWTNLSTTLAIEVVSDTVYAGSNSLRVSTTDFAGEYMVAYIPVTAGKTYNLSAWCNLQSYTGTSSARTKMALAYTYVDENGNNLDAAGNILSGDITSSSRGYTYIPAMTSAKNTWQQLSLTTSEVAPSNAAYIVLGLDASRVTAYFDNASVTEAGSVGITEETTTTQSTQLSVRKDGGNLVVTTEAGKSIEVYSILGAKIQREVAEDEETVISGLPKGQVLIVRSGNAVAKVVL